MPDSPRTLWLLAFARELIRLRPHVTHKFGMTIGANEYPKRGELDGTEAARRYVAERPKERPDA